MASVFSKIINGDIPAKIVGEDENFLAFLDVNPLQKGHTLVVPKKEIDYIFDLPDDLLSKMMLFSKEMARRLKLAFPCEKIAVSVIGLEVPHAHIHLIPMNKMQDVNFSNDKLVLSNEELSIIADKINSVH